MDKSPGFPGKAAADARIRMVLVPFPAGQHGLRHPHQARAVDLEIPLKGPHDEVRLQAVADVRVPVIEERLPVNVGNVVLAFVLHPPLGREFGVQRGAGQRGVEHELVKVGVVVHGVLDHAVDVRGGVALQSDDRRAQHARAVRLEPADQGLRVGAVEFAYWLSSPSRPSQTQVSPNRTSCSVL